MIEFAGRAVLLVMGFCGCVSAWSQEPQELIRAAVEELRATGVVEAHGAPLAARALLPLIYENREFELAWRTLAQIDSLLEIVDESYLEGLDPDDYHAATIRSVRGSLTDLAALGTRDRVDLDLLLTDSVIRLGYHLRFGRVDPTALDSNWNFGQEIDGENAARLIQEAIDAPSIRDFAARAIPRVFLYERFKTALAQYRALEAAGGWGVVPAGATLKPGMTDVRVPALAARLAVTNDLPSGAVAGVATTYDGVVVEGVRAFQSRHGLTADGAVGPATLAALNVPVGARVEQLRANLERARWVFYDPESEFLVVNIAGFQLYLVRSGEVVWRTRVQVGRPYRQTPVFRAQMTYLVFNPTWTVPPGILRQDVLPAIRRDVGYLAGRRMDVIDRNGAVVDPASVDWSGRSFPYQFVQRPGADNALGRIKFMFPNEHSVYLHDTPSRDLFERDNRAFSSGCIRVENPLELATMLLGPDWSRARLDRAIGSGRTDTIVLDRPMTVMLLYWTAEPQADGRIVFFPDVYERDPALIRELHEPFRAPPVL